MSNEYLLCNSFCLPEVWSKRYFSAFLVVILVFSFFQRLQLIQKEIRIVRRKISLSNKDKDDSSKPDKDASKEAGEDAEVEGTPKVNEKGRKKGMKAMKGKFSLG